MVDAPLDEAMGMKKKGLAKKDIADDLKNKGYSSNQVSDAMDQMDIKHNVGGAEPSVLDSIPVPEPPKEDEESYAEETNIRTIQRPMMQRPINQKNFNYGSNQEELIESIVDEKWQQIISTVGDIEIWKSRLNDELTAIKQEILRLGRRVDNIQESVLGKVTEYNQNITDVETDIKALEKVMKNILQPLTSNIKELSRITQDLKGKNPK